MRRRCDEPEDDEEDELDDPADATVVPVFGTGPESSVPLASWRDAVVPVVVPAIAAPWHWKWSVNERNVPESAPASSYTDICQRPRALWPARRWSAPPRAFQS